MRKIIPTFLFLVSLSCFGQVTPYMIQLLQKPNAISADAWLGLTNLFPGSNVTFTVFNGGFKINSVGGTGGTATNVYFLNSPFAIWSVVNNSNKVTIVGLQPANANLTNWSLILVSSKQDSSANLTNWSNRGTNEFELSGVAEALAAIWFSQTNSAIQSQFNNATNNGGTLTNLVNSSTVSAGANVTVTPNQNPDGSTNYQVASSGGGGSSSNTNMNLIVDEMFWTGTANQGPFVLATSADNSAAASLGTTENGHVEIIDLSTGATTNGAARIVSNSSVPTFSFGTGSHMGIQWTIKTPFQLSDGTDNYKIIVGVGNNANASTSLPTDGAMWQYSNNTNSGNWQCFVASNSVYLFTNSSIAVTSNSWWDLKIEQATNGWLTFSASSDSGNTWNSVGPITNTIPTADSGRSFKFYCAILKGNLGTSRRTNRVDRLMFWNY